MRIAVRAFQNGWGPRIVEQRDEDGIDTVNSLMGARYWYISSWGQNAVDQRWWTVRYLTTPGGAETATDIFY